MGGDARAAGACTGKVKSATAVPAPGCRAAFAARPASIRARSGSGDAPLVAVLAAARDHVYVLVGRRDDRHLAYRSAGTDARRPVSSRMPQAATISADIISATNVPAKDARWTYPSPTGPSPR